MKNNRIHLDFFVYICIIALSLYLSADLSGQGSKDYLSKVEGNALIYRGKIERPYNYKYQGTYFAYSPDYELGTIYYNRKLYEGVLINYNAHTSQVSVRQTPSHLPVQIESSLIEWFTMGDYYFEKIVGVKGLDDGFYQVVVDGDIRLIKKIKKEYREDLTTSSQGSTIVRVFDSVIDYYLEKGDVYTKVTGQKSFVKLFGEKKKEIKKVFRDAPKVVRNDKDELYKRVMGVL